VFEEIRRRGGFKKKNPIDYLLGKKSRNIKQLPNKKNSGHQRLQEGKARGGRPRTRNKYKQTTGDQKVGRKVMNALKHGRLLKSPNAPKKNQEGKEWNYSGKKRLGKILKSTNSWRSQKGGRLCTLNYEGKKKGDKLETFHDFQG